MRLLELERRILERLAPGLDAALEKAGFESCERRGSPALGLFRAHHAGRLLVPSSLAGAGASALEALRFQVALGSRAPSLAVATTMHQYKIAALCRLRPNQALDDVLRQIAERDWLVASGGAEGEAGRKLYQPRVRAIDSEHGVLIHGVKKPCCLTWSMDLLSVMVRADDRSRYGGELLHVLIDPHQPAVQRERFWASPLLEAAESDMVKLEGAAVPSEWVFRVGSAEAAAPFALAAFSWFEILAVAAYLGIASGLLERMIRAGKGTKSVRAAIACELDTVMAALEAVAVRLDQGELADELLSRIFRIRYVAEKQLPEVAARCFDALGGVAASRMPEAAYLLPVVRLLACHTPAFSDMSDNLSDQLDGQALVLS